RHAVAPGVSLQPDPVLGRKAPGRARRHPAGPEQSRRRRLGVAEQGTLRAPRDAGAGPHRPYRVAWLRAADELGRGAPCGAGEAGHAGAVQMTRAARTRRARWAPLAALATPFCAGVAVDGWLRTYGPPIPDSVRLKAEAAADTIRSKPDASAAAFAPSRTVDSRIEEPKIGATTGSIAHRGLRVPIDGAVVETWKGGFAERRGGGSRGHEAGDILSPRNTPVHAVASGTIAKIFESKAGGHTVYQFDAEGRLCYYYAHLERYADALREGQAVSQGDVIGYVGTSGNAPANAPHLHFAVFELGPDKRRWQGTPIDPYVVFTKGVGG